MSNGNKKQDPPQEPIQQAHPPEMPTIERIRALNLKPGDVFIVEFKGRAYESDEILQRLQGQMTQNFPNNRALIIEGDDLAIRVFSPKESELCHAGKDGDCNWSKCPQEANNRANYQNYCPLASDENVD